MTALSAWMKQYKITPMTLGIVLGIVFGVAIDRLSLGIALGAGLAFLFMKQAQKADISPRDAASDASPE
jgi:hypothetical protein